jgi:dipeptidyl aminopeptidase/acylaminoacyl peptidase
MTELPKEVIMKNKTGTLERPKLPKRRRHRQLLQLIACGLVGLHLLPWASAPAQEARKTVAQAKARQYPPLPENVERRQVTIWSDGTRMAGDLYLPTALKPEDKLPAIVFVAGTGGTKKGTPARMASEFVSRGYIFLAFDYRGWGESESKLLMLEPMPAPDENGEVTVKARAIRWQMDFADQVADIRNAIAFVSGEPNVDPARIGILGTSYGGGLVTWTAAHDPRVKCVVAQVPGMGGGRKPAAEQRAYDLLTRQTRGEAEPIPYESGAPGGKMSSYAHMRYNTAKGIGYKAVEAAEKITIPMLIIDAENEELMDPALNGKRVADILEANGAPVKYHVMKGISHYGIYREKFQEATDMEIEWFDRQLKEGRAQ